MLKLNAVLKYGGASLEDASSVKVLSSHVSNYMTKQPTILVVSAMKGGTNDLELLASYLSEKNISKARELLQKIYDFQVDTMENLFLSNDYCPVYDEIDRILTFDFDEYSGMPYDFICGKIVPVGELMSSVIVSSYLNGAGLKNRLIDARDYMVTSENPVNAQVLFGETEKKMKSIFTRSLLQENPLIVTQGFIGKSSNGLSSTIGREGSDYTAALLGTILEALNLGFWKMRGVDGNPQKISREEFKKIEENSTEGRLLYQKCLDFLIEKKKDFWIINSNDPDSRTLVC